MISNNLQLKILFKLRIRRYKVLGTTNSARNDIPHSLVFIYTYFNHTSRKLYCTWVCKDSILKREDTIT